MTLKVWLESVFTYNFNFAVHLVYRDITFFPYRPPLRFQAYVPSTLYVCICESLIQTHKIYAYWNTFECTFILKFELSDLETSRSTGDELEILLYGYSVYHED